MISLLYTEYNHINNERFNQYLKSLPTVMQQSINGYKRIEDAYACLLGKLLLQQGLQKHTSGEVSLHDIKYTKFTKPYLPNPIQFNISHSHNLVVCVIDSMNQIGVDVEKIMPVDLNDFRSQFTKLESTIISESPEPLIAFYQWWTKKESVAKADGRGLNIPLQTIVFKNSFEANLENKRWHLKRINLHSDYCVHVACEKPLEEEIQSEQYFF